MPLPEDYDSPEGEDTAETEVRKALVACFLAVGTPFGFTSDLAHTRPRYPRTDDKWESIGTIEDPDTTGNTTTTRLTRYASFKFLGFRRAGKELTIRYSFALGFGFKDEYGVDSNRNSFDEAASCAKRLGKFLADNPNLGLDDRVTHKQLEIFDHEFIKVDKQGNAANVLFGRIDVVLNVCQT
jgi:hypothetical protein